MEVLGLAMLHPTSEDEGDVGPSFARLLGNFDGMCTSFTAMVPPCVLAP